MGVLLYEKKDHVAYLTLNRPESMNAINQELGKALSEAWSDFDGDDQMRVAVLSGAGDKAFCSGMDLKERASKDASGENRRRTTPPVGLGTWKPVIAAIHGYCLAGGFRLAQSCDFRIAADDAVFGVREVKRGLMPGWTVELPKLIGLANALEIVLMGEYITPQRAYEMGFVNRVIPRKNLISEAQKWAEILTENAPLSVRSLKEVLYRGFTLPTQEAHAVAAHILHRVEVSEDIKEGPRAFAEKRKPVWKGR